ncbi:MAG: YtxH domain-containing protein [Chthonomonas sp.]|nr:YtxH domain-containing protein [Chthonomonas sp.]
MANNEENNSLVYLLAGFGLGALVGAAAGILFAPKAGDETREMIGDKAKELKGRTQEWIAEQKAKRAAVIPADEVGA